MTSEATGPTIAPMLRTLALVGALLACACGGGGGKINDAGPTDAPVFDGGTIDVPDPIDAGIDAPVGHPGTATVTGAVRAHSPSYSLYGTLRSGDGSTSSPSYQRRGGVTGATQP